MNNMYLMFGVLMAIVICSTIVSIYLMDSDLYNVVIGGVVGGIFGMYSSDFIHLKKEDDGKTD